MHSVSLWAARGPEIIAAKEQQLISWAGDECVLVPRAGSCSARLDAGPSARARLKDMQSTAERARAKAARYPQPPRSIHRRRVPKQPAGSVARGCKPRPAHAHTTAPG